MLLQYLARTTLTRGACSPADVLKLARERLAQEKKPSAILLLKEIIRHDPANTDAEALLAPLTRATPTPPSPP